VCVFIVDVVREAVWLNSVCYLYIVCSKYNLTITENVLLFTIKKKYLRTYAFLLLKRR